MLLEQQPHSVPWEALTYVTGHIHYGGRVTDDWDRRCVLSLLDRFYCEDALRDGYCFAAPADEGGPMGGPVGIGDGDHGEDAAATGGAMESAEGAADYVAPPPGSLDDYRTYVDALPADDAVGLFGMHENAKISHGLAEAAAVLRTIVDIQPRLGATGGAGSSESTAASLALRLTEELPAPLLRSEALRGSLGTVGEDGHVDVGALTSLQLVLLHEIEHFNTLIATIARSLEDLQLAISGALVMSADLERMLSSMLRGEVPAMWAKVAYPSLKPLGSWYSNLQERVAFMRGWLVGYRPPERFALPHFFMPQGFLTGVLQMHARKHRTPIDFLAFAYKLLDEPSPEILASAATHQKAVAKPGGARADADGADAFVPAPPPEDGVFVEGLYLAGARYNRTLRELQPPRSKQMVDPLPAIHFLPVEGHVRDEGSYECPLYKTSARAGTLSTTGASTNFIVALEVPTPRAPADVWIRMGVAAICSTAD